MLREQHSDSMAKTWIGEGRDGVINPTNYHNHRHSSFTLREDVVSTGYPCRYSGFKSPSNHCLHLPLAVPNTTLLYCPAS